MAAMHTVAEARDLILRHARPLPAEFLPLASDALGLVLAEDVAGDLDMPPHDKAMMDGYAVRSADLADGRATLSVVEEITAGRTPQKALGPGQASRIMTGAPIPQGADAVVMVERTREAGPGRVEIEDSPRPGQHVLARGREMRQGEVVLPAGTVLRPQEFGLLATMGRTAARVIPPPRVAILSTGDELVEAGQTPGPGQIRNSNGPMLAALVSRAGALPRSLGIGRDSREALEPLIAEGLAADVLLLSGGVSAGKLDLVPEVLQKMGVTAQLHKVVMKPGKPAFFGTRPGPSGKVTLAFGLPGNPVSSLVCFELFVRPALRKLRGLASPGPHFLPAVLAEDFPYRTDRPTYHPARLEVGADGRRVWPVPWFGSADLRGLTRANALIELPIGDHTHRAGQTFPVLALDG
jgi:molybdopterin molybdotransferase